MNWQDFVDLFNRGIPLSGYEIGVALVFATLCSIVIILMYNYFYSNENVGAGVQRSFLLMGPAITALFLGIQFSLPLSLGLLGALSIIRFRTPVKDPAEIGFIMLLIATAISCATFNYLLVGFIFVLSFIVLLGRKMLFRRSVSVRGSLIITLNGPELVKLEANITRFLTSKLHNVKLQSISTTPDTTSLHYHFSKRSGFNWGSFTEELSLAAAPAKVNIYIG